MTRLLNLACNRLTAVASKSSSNLTLYFYLGKSSICISSSSASISEPIIKSLLLYNLNVRVTPPNPFILLLILDILSSYLTLFCLATSIGTNISAYFMLLAFLIISITSLYHTSDSSPRYQSFTLL